MARWGVRWTKHSPLGSIAPVMKTTWIGQPLEGFGGWTADWLRDTLADPRVTRLRIAVAWMKRSGLSRISPFIRQFHQAGGKSEVIVGIDEGGATKEGLEDTLQLFDHAYVFHDPGRRTFHPKVYLASGNDVAALIVGSNNLTAGGLYSNYEASVVCETDFTEDGDRSFFEILDAWFETLLGESELCLPLTVELISLLVADPRYRIGTEGARKRRREDSDSVTTDTLDNSLFGQGRAKKKGLPRRNTATVRRLPGTARAPAARRGRRLQVQRALEWSKVMTRSDAQQPPNASSAVTGNLRLTQAGNPIDQKTYFRRAMFGSARWRAHATSRGVREEAQVPFEVTIAETRHGMIDLRVDHADYRVAGQNNAPTWLHWGSLMPILRQADFTGRRVRLSRLSDGHHTLEIE